MKKHISYIFILIILTGILFPFIKAHASAGTCVTKDSTTGALISSIQMDSSECDTQHSPPTRAFIPGSAPTLTDGGPAPTTPTNQNPNYELIQPLPNPSGGGLFSTFDPKGDNKIGEYLNLIIKIFLGVCAVLAVIMIVKAGIEYMGSELISSKEEARKDIQGAIFGLLLALGSWLILSTINPEILKTDLKSVEGVTIDVTVDESPATAVAPGSTETSGPTTGCSEGMTNASGIIVCKSIADGVNRLIAKARAENIPLAGGGFRSIETQTRIRAQNCHGDLTSPRPNPPCNPPTAVPGNSMHQSGKAIDFTCSGVFIQNQTNQCFVWLSANAGIAGLSNFPKEPWHWSTNGR